MFGSKKTIYKIEGMTCKHCVMHVTKAIEAVPDVKSVKVDLAKKQAVVKGEAEKAAIKQAVSDAGYQVVEVIK